MAQASQKVRPGYFRRTIVVNLFVVAAVVGGASIIALRLFAFHALYAAAAGCAMIFIYASVAVLVKPRASPTGLIGDNSYYLGFIYTLTSLAWSLYVVTEADGGDVVLQIVSGFGIALLTTAFGVVARVALNPPRADIVEEEQAIFRSIRHYYSIMHRDLHSLTTTNKQFALGVQRSMQEFKKSFVEELSDEATFRKNSIMKVLESAETDVQDRLTELKNKSVSSLEEAIDDVTQAATDQVASSVATMGAAVQGKMETVVRDLADVGTQSAEVINKMAENIESAQSALESATDAIGNVVQSTDKELSDKLGSLITSVGSNISGISTKLDKLEQSSSEIADRLKALTEKTSDLEQFARSRSQTVGPQSWEFDELQFSVRESVTEQKTEQQAEPVEDTSKAGWFRWSR